MTIPRRKPDPIKTPTWFKAWFAFCALVGAGVLGLLVWLAITAIDWMNRH